MSINDLARPDLSFRELCDWDIEITTDQRSQQHKQRCARAKAQFCIGELQDVELDQNDKKNKQPNKKEKERQRERNVLKLIHGWRASEVGPPPQYH